MHTKHGKHDNFVILCRRRAEDALAEMHDMMRRLKLTVNETKTHVCRLPAESFDFLGYTFGRMYSPRTGGAYLGTQPARQGARGLPPGSERVGVQAADVHSTGGIGLPSQSGVVAFFGGRGMGQGIEHKPFL